LQSGQIDPSITGGGVTNISVMLRGNEFAFEVNIFEKLGEVKKIQIYSMKYVEATSG
jgi:hypothetical protein